MNQYKNVIIYSGNNCPACIKAKEYLQELQVSYVEKNVDDSYEAQLNMAKLGSEALPTIVIDQEVIVGFSKKRIKLALGIEH